MKKALLCAAAMVGLAAASSAMAQPMGGMMNDPFGDATVTRADAQTRAAARFDTLDTNHDGILAPEEMAAGRPAGASQRPPREGAPGGARGGMGRMMDANGDGKITRDEYVNAQLQRFDRMDENKDGKLTKTERDDFMADMRARMELRMGGGGGDGPPPGQ